MEENKNMVAIVTVTDWIDAYKTALRDELQAIKDADFKALEAAQTRVYELAYGYYSHYELAAARCINEVNNEQTVEDLERLESGIDKLETDQTISDEDWARLPYDLDEVSKTVYLRLSERGLID